MDFLVKRDDLHETRIAESEAPELDEGQALLKIDSFGLTTNNITYALMGDAMNYWDFFPAPEGWGRVPMWGYGDVVATEADGVTEGTRVFGYLPPSTYLVVQPDRASSTDFVDATPFRSGLPAAYNRYLRTAGDEMYEEENEDEQMLLWPLFFTSWLIDDFLDDEDLFGAEVALLSSASSRTSSALAHLLARREIEVIGLTSPGNVEFVEGLGPYDRAVPYEGIGELEPRPAVYVDMSGDAKVRGAVHETYGDQLKHSSAVGLTHREDLGGAKGLPGPQPEFFFAPTRLKKRAADWGGEGVNTRLAEDWPPYVAWVKEWLEVEHHEGPEELERVYLETLDGKSDPAVGHVISLPD